MTQELKRTPLCDEHEALGARMVDFGGWYMPVQYAGLVDEHKAVRGACGLFDVSHMGEVRVQGAGAKDYLDYLTTNRVGRIEDGQAQYTVMAYENGTVVDDLLIYCIERNHYLLVINAANIDKDVAWLRQHAGPFDVQITDESPRTAQLAIQGPQAEAILNPLTDMDLSDMGYYRFAYTTVDGIHALVSRTGYTGEDGFECYVANQHAAPLWRKLLAAGADHGIQPAGLGARDTLRLEARMHLYGNDMDDTTTVLEAGLGWVCKTKKASDFIGKAALKQQKKAGLTRKLVGFEVQDRGIARQGSVVLNGDADVGVVTSGTYGPTVEKSIGMAYVPVAMSEAGTELTIRVRKKELTAKVVKGPFYKRS